LIELTFQVAILTKRGLVVTSSNREAF
jgi:hypothetical protein